MWHPFSLTRQNTKTPIQRQCMQTVKKNDKQKPKMGNGDKPSFCFVMHPNQCDARPAPRMNTMLQRHKG